MNVPYCCVISYILISSFIGVIGQPSTQDFISLDCGIAANQSYTDTTTGLTYNSDDEFIGTGTGTGYKIASNFLISSPSKQYQTIRNFPNGTRNCYTLPATQGQRYLIRAGFMYGNYDGLNSKSILFDLHIGVNFWKTIEITNASYPYRGEIITLSPADFVFICLVNTGHGTPFISLLEMRPLKESIYKFANASQSLNLYTRIYPGPSTVRYRLDQYDRMWTTRKFPGWDTITTDKTVSNYNHDDFEAPSAVLQFAGTASSMNFSWGDGNTSTEYFSIFYFSELVDMTNTNMSRMFSIYYGTDTKPWVDPFSPPYLQGLYYYSNGFFTGRANHNFTLKATSNSTLPPIINAIEVYNRLVPTQPMTNLTDVGAMQGIKKDYQVKKNWMGDPCFPVQYEWDGLKCISGTNGAKIISVNLSYSELDGVVSNSFASLQSVQFLDLSHNHLNGTIPDFLAYLASLQFLNLMGNNFTGDVPEVLLKKANSGILDLRYDKYKKPDKKKISTTIIVVIAIAGVLLVAIVALIIWLIACRKSSSITGAQSRDAPMAAQVIQIPPRPNINREITPKMHIEGKEFRFFQIEIMTQKFSRVIGKGGFGTVYYGISDDGTEIAVKLCSHPSAQGAKEFLAEARSLTKVHHKNLVGLIGYCMEPDHLALIYEYMPRGSLSGHLAGRTGGSRALSWRQRLQIALDAAKGLDYLHTGCEMIHRDIKSSNILLGPNLEAKISDFGLSKLTGTATQAFYTGIVGTPGYIDPEAHKMMKLTDKSDVYSFGIVLLELITGESPFKSNQGNQHIAQRVSTKLSRGNIDTIVDPTLHGNYSTKSAWKVVDVAMKCVASYSAERPTMAEVVMQLKESLDLEIFRDKSGGDASQSSGGEFTSMNFAPAPR